MTPSRWRRAVEAACTYALRWGTQELDRVPEAQVRDLELVRERQARRVERALAEVARHRELGRSVERDVGPSL